MQNPTIQANQMTTTQAKTKDISSSPPSNREQKESPSPVCVAIPDRRRNSIGEHMHSPNETWRPSNARRMSWDREDLKREHYVKQLSPESAKNEVGEEKGFTEIVSVGVIVEGIVSEPSSYGEGEGK